MEITHNNHYQAYVSENGKDIANAGFYGEYTLDEATELKCYNSDLFLVVGLDQGKYRDYDNGSLDFQEEYARKVAQMVYEMMLVQ